jgi:hypothetical protein
MVPFGYLLQYCLSLITILHIYHSPGNECMNGLYLLPISYCRPYYVNSNVKKFAQNISKQQSHNWKHI